jgi:pyridoxamine 5'-phosphate oxidase
MVASVGWHGQGRTAVWGPCEVNDSDEWAETLPTLLDQVWLRLAHGVADARAAARHPVFATTSPSGWPEARTVVLRSAGRSAARVTVHTDLYSGKISSLRAAPRAALHVWDEGVRLQIRLQASVEILSGDAVAQDWARVPDHARQSYGVTPPPGSPIAAALAYQKAPDPATFAVLRCQIVHVDAVHLGGVHRRARFEAADGWQGQWLAP